MAVASGLEALGVASCVETFGLGCLLTVVTVIVVSVGAAYELIKASVR